MAVADAVPTVDLRGVTRRPALRRPALATAAIEEVGVMRVLIVAQDKLDRRGDPARTALCARRAA